jgi:hypothetical protein
VTIAPLVAAAIAQPVPADPEDLVHGADCCPAQRRSLLGWSISPCDLSSRLSQVPSRWAGSVEFWVGWCYMRYEALCM